MQPLTASAAGIVHAAPERAPLTALDDAWEIESSTTSRRARSCFRVLAATLFALCVSYVAFTFYARHRRRKGIDKIFLVDNSSASLGVNIVFVKVFKAASTTTAGVVRRLAYRHGLSGFNESGWEQSVIREPGVFANHMSREGMTASLRYLRLPVLFVTMIRHPAERCLSQFYHFTISMHGLTVKGNGTRDKLSALRGCRDEQFKYMRAAATDSIEKVWGAYAFIGVAHRYPESALMLARACGGTDADALYLDAKVADGRPAYFSSHHYNFSRHLPLSDEPREVQAYAMSDDFRRANSRDLALLHKGEARIESWVSLPNNAKALRAFQAMHARVVAQCDAGDFCSTKPQRGVMHGTASGRRLDQGCVGKDPRCLWGDNGCGYQCMDSIAAEMAGGRASR